MFGHHQLEGRHILDLPPLDHLASHSVQGTLAGVTARRAMPHLDIGDSNVGQGVPRVPRLAARLAHTPHPLAARTTTQPITGGWFAAVVAIFGKPLFQVSQALGEDRHLLLGGG
jgi:hypothetical protein